MLWATVGRKSVHPNCDSLKYIPYFTEENYFIFIISQVGKYYTLQLYLYKKIFTVLKMNWRSSTCNLGQIQFRQLTYFCTKKPEYPKTVCKNNHSQRTQ